jgi:Fe-S cluster assembly iron-binding protein IscA
VLTLTDAAVAAIRDLLAQKALPARGGLRISAAAPANGGDEPGFEIAVVASGEATDAVAERDGAYVYLEPAAVSVFDDKVLDARLGMAGVSFTFQPSLVAAPAGASGNVSTSFDVLRTARPVSPDSSEG